MSINLKNFIKVNIDYIESSTPLDYQTVVLFWKRVNPTKIEGEYTTIITEGVYTSEKAANEGVTDDVFDKYAYAFFQNGGKSLRVIEYTEDQEAETPATGADRIIELMNQKGIASNQIVICTNLGVTNTDNNVTSIAVDPDLASKLPNAALDTDFTYNGKDTKIVVTCFDYDQLNPNITSYKEINHLAVKVGKNIVKTYGEAPNPITVRVPDGSQLALAAYLTNTDYTKVDTYKDYMYTVEKLDNESQNYDLTQANYKICKNNNFNCVDKVSSERIALGGDLTNGKDVVNDFALVVLQNVLSTTLYNLVVKKLKYNSTTIAVVRDQVANVLDQFISNGYISTDLAWVDEDVVIDDLIIVAKGSRLQNGYVIYIADMTPELREENTLPNIYVVLNDSTGIRYINLLGKVN